MANLLLVHTIGNDGSGTDVEWRPQKLPQVSETCVSGQHLAKCSFNNYW